MMKFLDWIHEILAGGKNQRGGLIIFFIYTISAGHVIINVLHITSPTQCAICLLDGVFHSTFFVGRRHGLYLHDRGVLNTNS